MVIHGNIIELADSGIWFDDENGNRYTIDHVILTHGFLPPLTPTLAQVHT